MQHQATSRRNLTQMIILLATSL